MGKIKTSGNASIKAVPDRCRYELTVKETGSTSGEAAKKVIIASEAFLKELKKALNGLSKVKFDRDRFDTCENNGRTTYIAKRYLKMDLPADVKLNNKVTAAVARTNANVTLDTEAFCSKEPEIRRGLMAKAVKNSREMAEIIAESQGERITGIDKVNLRERHYDDEWDEFGSSFDCDFCGSGSLLDEIDVSEVEFSEMAEVIWLSEGK